jgi:hypothetical protein
MMYYLSATMARLLFTVNFLFITVSGIAQASDFISIRKKNNRTVKTYFPGVVITFQTTFFKMVEGQIVQIKNDSVFVKQWDIRIVPTNLGVTVVDTAGSYITSVHYKEIKVVYWDKRKKLHEYLTNGSLLMIGGTGYAALNVINGAYLNEPITDSRNLRSLGIALGAAGTGYLLSRLNGKEAKFERKYRVHYIRMNEKKKQLRGF